MGEQGVSSGLRHPGGCTDVRDRDGVVKLWVTVNAGGVVGGWFVCVSDNFLGRIK